MNESDQATPPSAAGKSSSGVALMAAIHPSTPLWPSLGLGNEVPPGPPNSATPGDAPALALLICSVAAVPACLSCVASSGLFSFGLIVDRISMTLLRTSNQNGAPIDAAKAVSNHPRIGATTLFQVPSAPGSPRRLGAPQPAVQPIGRLIELSSLLTSS